MTLQYIVVAFMLELDHKNRNNKTVAIIEIGLVERKGILFLKLETRLTL